MNSFHPTLIIFLRISWKSQEITELITDQIHIVSQFDKYLHSGRVNRTNNTSSLPHTSKRRSLWCTVQSFSSDDCGTLDDGTLNDFPLYGCLIIRIIIRSSVDQRNDTNSIHATSNRN